MLLLYADRFRIIEEFKECLIWQARLSTWKENVLHSEALHRCAALRKYSERGKKDLPALESETLRRQMRILSIFRAGKLEKNNFGKDESSSSIFPVNINEPVLDIFSSFFLL